MKKHKIQDLLCVNALVLVRINRSRALPAAVVGVLDDTKMDTVALSYKVEKAPKNTFEVRKFDIELEEILFLLMVLFAIFWDYFQT